MSPVGTVDHNLVVVLLYDSSNQMKHFVLVKKTPFALSSLILAAHVSSPQTQVVLASSPLYLILSQSLAEKSTQLATAAISPLIFILSITIQTSQEFSKFMKST